MSILLHQNKLKIDYTFLYTVLQDFNSEANHFRILWKFWRNNCSNWLYMPTSSSGDTGILHGNSIWKHHPFTYKTLRSFRLYNVISLEFDISAFIHC